MHFEDVLLHALASKTILRILKLFLTFLMGTQLTHMLKVFGDACVKRPVGMLVLS